MDIVSYLMGKAAGGGGSGGSSMLPVYEVGFFGNSAGQEITLIDISIKDLSGKYALISVMHRSNLTTPSGCELLDKSTHISPDGTTTQYVSLFKTLIANNDTTIRFQQAQSARMNASAWAFDSDYQLTKKETTEFRCFNWPNDLAIVSSDLTFFTFNIAITPSSNWGLYGVSDGAWLCQDPTTQQQTRHFTGVVPASSSKTTRLIIRQRALPTLITSDSTAQVVTYTISKA